MKTKDNYKYLTIVCSRSVGHVLRVEVYVMTYFAVDGIYAHRDAWGKLDPERREESNGTYCAFMA